MEKQERRGDACDYCGRPTTVTTAFYIPTDTGTKLQCCELCYRQLQQAEYQTQKLKQNPYQGLKQKDPINPAHYRDHPSGVECITITQHENFCIGNAIKYLWRRRKKDLDKEVEDLKKAVWYIQQEIVRLTDGGQQMSKAQSVGKQYEPTHNLGIPYAPEDPANPKSLV